MIGVVVALILLDQAFKIFITTSLFEKSMDIIPGILKFSYVENRGMAFGMGNSSTVGFIVTNIIVLGIIIKFTMSQQDRIDTKTNAVICLVLAGGFSNLIDRIFRGFVVDFIDITPLFQFPVFNIADICIVVGWFLLVLFIAIYTYKEVIQKKQK